MADKLPEGRFYGRTLRTWHAADMAKVGAAVGVAGHGGQSRECGPRVVAFHPPEEWHAERILAPVRSFNIEATPAALTAWRQ